MKENEIYKDDEIDLVELFATLWKGKIKILVITVAFLVVGILYTLIATPWYKASALVETGYYNINENGVIKSIMLEEPKNIIEKLKTRYIDLLKDVEGKDVDVKSVNEIKNNNKFFSIEVLGKSNEKAVKMIDEMIQSVSDEHKKIIDGYISSQKVKLANIDRQIKFLQNNKIVEVQSQIDNVKQIIIPKLDKQIKYAQETTIPFAKQDLKNIDDIILKNIEEKIKLENDNLKKYTTELNTIKSNNAKQNTNLEFTINLNQLITSAKSNLIELEKNKNSIITITRPQMQARIDELEMTYLSNLQIEKEKALNDTLPALQRDLTNLQTNELEKLLDQKTVIELALKPFNYKNTSIVSQIITSKHPEKPKKLIILAVALLAGAMIGIFWVLFADFMKKRRELEMPEKTETSSQEVEQNLQNLIEKRAEFYKFMDENIEKIPNCDAYDFKDDEKMKKLYEKFFAFDYRVRKILPFIYKAYGVKPDV
ncbi:MULTISPECIES: CmeU family protein [Campylobacter]|uniref:CmeU family protein n=1 Tax=Campylobacter TaxID=194 RepID=UPI0023F1120F|nr:MULTISPECIES: CmeU family protein [Campylobacter]MCI6641378.1 Wzz/FepE/Etk N-terminal domain-containing protein [Campylobacter sp.]MDD7422509.1 CmeU family protein [Campylobacter hominis]MDY3117160.1 CmeU family protein [Campylobacter hominis]